MKTVSKVKLGELLEEYKDKNTDNRYKTVAVGRYGIRKREEIYSKELAKDYSKNKLIYKDTLTIGMGSKQIDIGILAEDEIYAVSPAYHTYRINNIDSNYLRYCLEARNADMSKRFMIESARQGKSVDFEKMFKYEIPIYSDSDTNSILYNLGVIEDIISNLDKQIEKMDVLVKSRFIEMFGDPLKSEEHEPLSKVAILERGRFSPRPRNDPQYYDGDYPFVQTGDIANCDHRLSDFEQTLNEKGIKVSKCFKAGTILIAIVGATIGATAILQRDMYAPDSVIGITVSEQYEPIFMEMLLRFWKDELLRIAPDAARANINLEILGKVQIMKVSIEKQKEFVAFMQQVDKSKLAIYKIKKHVLGRRLAT